MPSKSVGMHAFTRNLFPNVDLFSRALSEIIIDNNWRTYTLIYEDDYGLMKMQDILQLHNPGDHPIMVRQLPDDGDYKPLLKEIATLSETHIILDCSLDKVVEVLSQAKTVKMFGIYQSYLITTIDAHTLDFSGLELSDKSSNVTTIRFHNPESVDAQAATHDWRQGERMKNHLYNIAPEQIKTEALLIHDAVRLFANGLREYAIFDEVSVEPMDCSSPTKWTHGEEILKMVDEVSASRETLLNSNI